MPREQNRFSSAFLLFTNPSDHQICRNPRLPSNSRLLSNWVIQTSIHPEYGARIYNYFGFFVPHDPLNSTFPCTIVPQSIRPRPDDQLRSNGRFQTYYRTHAKIRHVPQRTVANQE